MIPRMYHSTAALTPDGTILIAGCDRCTNYNFGDEVEGVTFQPSYRTYLPTRSEYRAEVFAPAVW